MVLDFDIYNLIKIIYFLNILIFLFIYLIRLVKDIMGMLCFVVSFFIYGSEVIDLFFWLRIVERIDIGCKLVNIIRFIEVLVWLVFFKILFFLYLRGNIWFGFLKLFGLVLREVSVRIVMVLFEVEIFVDVFDFVFCN